MRGTDEHIDPTMTLGVLVNAHPQLARQFESRGLDYYCCGGSETLFVGPVAELAKARARKMAAAMGRLLADVSDVADAPVEVVWPGTGDRCVNPTRRCLPKG